MKTLDIVTSQNVTIEYQLATIPERFLALLLDYLILFIYLLILAAVLNGVFQSSWNSERVESLAQILILPVFFFYHLVFEIFNGGRSPGKAAMGIKVVNLHGQNPGMVECSLRWAFRPVEITFTLGALAAIYVSSSEKSQRLGDLVARTVVVKLNRVNKHTLKEVLSIKSKENYKPVYTQVTRYTDEEMLFVKICLDRVRRYPNTHNKRLIDELTQKVCTQLNVSPIPDKKTQPDFLKQVLQDYIVITRS
jgi:uncharacterized RDD family membrane protein YckC